MPKHVFDPRVPDKDVLDDPKIGEFLNHYRKRTKRTYTSLFRRVVEFSGMNGTEILSDPNLWRKKKIFDLQSWLLDHGYGEYYTQTATSMIRGYFRYNDQPLMFNRSDSKRLAERNRKTEDYLFSKEDIFKMAMIGNIRERYGVTCWQVSGFKGW